MLPSGPDCVTNVSALLIFNRRWLPCNTFRRSGMSDCRLGEAIVDALGEGHRALEEAAAEQGAAQAIEACLGQDRVASPHALSLVAGQRAGQDVPVKRREIFGDRRGNRV